MSILETLELLNCVLHLIDEQHTEDHSKNRIENHNVEFSFHFLPYIWLNIFTLLDQQK